MPISCPLALRCLGAAEFEQIDYRVMGHAFASQNELGRLCEEGVYQRDLQARLLADGFGNVRIEMPVTVSHGGFSKVYFLDLVADHAIYELKAAVALTREHQAQLLHYLFLLGVTRGKLINFRPPKVEGRIHATRLTAQLRHRVTLDVARWRAIAGECAVLREAMAELIADWGAFLDFALYQEALTHLLGGEQRVIQRLPLRRGRILLGTQQFHVHSPGVAFQVTSVSAGLEATEGHLRRLVSLADLGALQWINLNRSTIQFITLVR